MRWRGLLCLGMVLALAPSAAVPQLPQRPGLPPGLEPRWPPPHPDEVAKALIGRGLTPDDVKWCWGYAGVNAFANLDVTRRCADAVHFAPLLETWIRASRDQLAAGAMPRRIRRAMEQYYDDSLLTSVRAKVGNPGDITVGGASMGFGGRDAVVMDTAIAFRDGRKVDDLVLWAHELKHVEQYRRWGVLGFAKRYIFSFETIENEATAAEERYQAAMTRVGATGISNRNEEGCHVLGVGAGDRHDFAVVAFDSPRDLVVRWTVGSARGVERTVRFLGPGRTVLRSVPANAGGRIEERAHGVSIYMASGTGASTDQLCVEER